MSILAPQGKNLLFKYCHSRKVASEHGIFTGTGISLRATPPNAFNDPFEFASNLLTDNEQLEIERLVKLDDLGPGTEAILSGTLLTYEDTASRWLRLREQVSQTKGIVCLSACWNDILMWSHYADEHRGFAVAIDRDHQYVQEVFNFESVKYSSQRPSCSIAFDAERQGFKITADHVKASLYTKSMDWSYEHEWRSVRALDVVGKPITLVDVPADAIPLILLGWRHLDETRSLISAAISAWPVKPEIIVLKPHWTDFSMDIGKWLGEEKWQLRQFGCKIVMEDSQELPRIMALMAGLDIGRSRSLRENIAI